MKAGGMGERLARFQSLICAGSTVRPVSSSTSRRAVSTQLSPSSRLPVTDCQKPAGTTRSMSSTSRAGVWITTRTDWGRLAPDMGSNEVRKLGNALGGQLHEGPEGQSGFAPGGRYVGEDAQGGEEVALCFAVEVVRMTQDQYVTLGLAPAHVRKAVFQCVPVVAEPGRKGEGFGEGGQQAILVADLREIEIGRASCRERV